MPTPTTSDDFCKWSGAQHRLVRYAVESFGLRGTLSRLNQLQVLSLRNNSLFGPPPDFSPLINLRALFLDQNCFSGAYPAVASVPPPPPNSRSVCNYLTGPMPENLTGLVWLSYLRVDSNRFSGPLPALNQSSLEVLNISINSFNGPVPVTATLERLNISLPPPSPSPHKLKGLWALGFMVMTLCGLIAIGVALLLERLERWHQVHALDAA